MKFAYLRDAPLMAASSGHRLKQCALDVPAPHRDGAVESIGLNVVIAAFGVYAGLNVDRILPAKPVEATLQAGPVMTYNGMDLEAFAEFIGLPADDPYTIAAFEDMCAPETAS